MTAADERLVQKAGEFADEVADLLVRTVCDDPPVTAQVRGNRVVVATLDEDGDEVAIPLRIAGEHRLDLKVRFRCTWDSTGQFLAISDSEFALALPRLREPLVRFDYQRDRRYAPAHVQVHAENSAVGYLLAWSNPDKPPRVQALHLPVGGKRFRPCLEDVIEFAIEDLRVEAKDGWQSRIAQGRATWKQVQLAATLRDVVDNGEEPSAELRDAVLRAATLIQASSDAR